MVVQALLLGILAGFGIWDGRVAGQTMFERPIVLGPIVGLILGDVQTGIIMGASVELVMMGVVGIGAAVPPDVVCGGILSTAFAILWPRYGHGSRTFASDCYSGSALGNP